ncbi:hypothetical protein ACAW74_19055 [Fibrella sp. WM1]|uniref:hypothetical protein n=1 Tax=Fibrella musci TaxID=3242485 RepID=UPI0035213265
MNRFFLSIGLLLGCVACVSNRPMKGHTPTDPSEYYVKASPLEELNRRILPDPIGGLGHSNDIQLRVTDIRLTNQYTVLYMLFDHGVGQNAGGSTQISIDPKAKLVSRDGKSTFAFVKAEGIPQTPEHLDVQAADKARFILYFERLTPGLNEFALFECEDTATTTCWNITDMHVENPAQ